MLLRAFLQGMAITVVSLGAAFFVLYTGHWYFGQGLADDSRLYLEACTACWAGIMVGQGFNLIAQRSSTAHVFKKGFGGNKFIIPAYLSIMLAFIIAIYLPPVQDILYTRPFPIETWLVMLCLAPLVLITDTLWKMVVAPRIKRQ